MWRRLETEHPPFSVLFASGAKDRINCLRGNVEEKARILEATEQLVRFAKGEAACSEMEAFSLILHLLLLSTQLYATAPRVHATPPGNPLVQRTVEYITKHYDEKLTLKELAQKAGCSTVYLSRSFRRYMGSSVHQYLTEYRISKAAALLRAGCSVTETCYRVEFSDCSGFIRTFSHLMKMTPYKYKKGLGE